MYAESSHKCLEYPELLELLVAGYTKIGAWYDFYSIQYLQRFQLLRSFRLLPTLSTIINTSSRFIYFRHFQHFELLEEQELFGTDGSIRNYWNCSSLLDILELGHVTLYISSTASSSTLRSCKYFQPLWNTSSFFIYFRHSQHF